eukprot:CAMPEP_0204154512 /NCGR_PEP_ID=MMETSP0361-20130328/28771_1 /ASSEMBLY_ACC=CAM_ASM_000343 /TAXON_ID=268821 /ORGANISM="Scrippsiella Hangoei, Strain SHTV-5" /LENGTH=61 /DNA_ID=CAMNT_0051109793 /DNA_START=11 /DNA_END=196 /DNA_ORIENTATION=-
MHARGCQWCAPTRLHNLYKDLMGCPHAMRARGSGWHEQAHLYKHQDLLRCPYHARKRQRMV